MALQVHPGERGERSEIRVLALRPLPVAHARGCHLMGQLGGAAQLTAQRLHEREMAKAVDAFAFFSRGSCGGRPRIEDPGCPVEPARPQLGNSASAEYAGTDFG